MSDEFDDPIWAAAKQGGKIGAATGWFLGFALPWGGIALAMILPNDESEIGALIPFVPIFLAPLGFVCLGFLGTMVGSLFGWLRQRRSNQDDTQQPS